MSGGGLFTLPMNLWTESMVWSRQQLERNGRWFDAATKLPEVPVWATPNEVVFENACVKLRKFTLPEESSVTHIDSASSVRNVPIMVITPQINHSFICDYAPNQSLVRTLLGQGFKNVYGTEWKSANLARSEESLDFPFETIEEMIDHVGGRAHLVGLCQGGWMSIIHGAMRPGQVESLTLAAAPVDFHASPGAVNWVAWMTPMMTYRAYVAMGGGILRGQMVRIGFNNLRPLERYIGNYMKMWSHIDNPEFIKRFGRLQNWYNTPQHLPGNSYLKIVEDLFKKNKLIKGTFHLRGERVDLSRVTAPLYMIAGTRDHITPKGQLFAAEQHVSSPVARQYMADAGHIGVFMGSKSLRDVWPVLLDDMCKDCLSEVKAA